MIFQALSEHVNLAKDICAFDLLIYRYYLLILSITKKECKQGAMVWLIQSALLPCARPWIPSPALIYRRRW